MHALSSELQAMINSYFFVLICMYVFVCGCTYMYTCIYVYVEYLCIYALQWESACVCAHMYLYP